MFSLQKVVEKNAQCNSQKWSRCDKSIFFMFLIWKPIIPSCFHFHDFCLCPDPHPFESNYSSLYHTKLKEKIFGLSLSFSSILSVRFLNVMTKFLGTKTWNKFPVICLMQGLLLKEKFLKCRSLMSVLIIIPFYFLNFKRNLHNLTPKI